MQTRDFISVRDIVQANLLAMESKNAVGEIFNVATGSQIDLLKLLDILKSITKTQHIQHKFAPPRTGDVKFGLASIDKIKNTLGFTPQTPISDGLVDVTEFIKSMMNSRLIQA
jgi:nucleoside-diphosphate-sugar epimerase